MRMLLWATVVAVGLHTFALALDEDHFAGKRQAMVERQLKARGIADPEVLRVMGKVPRHRFVDPSYAPLAYADRPLPIGEGQTISQPYIVALMTELLRLKPSDKVLEVGTGSGYQAAILAELAREVYTVEIFPSLGKKAVQRLTALGYESVKVKIGDGYFGWKEHAPFDAIVVTAAANHLPPPLLDQLKEGGRMAIPVGAPFYTQSLILAEKRNGKVLTNQVAQVLFVPLLGGHGGSGSRF
ncbi:MAG: protein-L-isoaspartate(D-aspartate) O-methyltransferase [candidate division NC10 bacterium]|nr:protein-L-isoaspartate(D-aspartate) O-methyltransferase [candidate division NC10 bacterium]